MYKQQKKKGGVLALKVTENNCSVPLKYLEILYHWINVQNLNLSRWHVIVISFILRYRRSLFLCHHRMCLWAHTYILRKNKQNLAHRQNAESRIEMIQCFCCIFPSCIWGSNRKMFMTFSTCFSYRWNAFFIIKWWFFFCVNC